MTGGQLGNVYALWLKAHADRAAVPGGAAIPITWFQSITSIGTVALTPLILKMWARQARRDREPELLSKMGMGLAMAAAALAWLAGLSRIAETGSPVNWPWLLPTHLLLSVGYIYVYPVGLALFSRSASTSARALFIGIFFLTSFVASNLVGLIGRYYERMAPSQFWCWQAAIGAAGALLVLLLGRVLGHVIRSHADA
jgi:POT family proton-dependent oligopeptide transporter